MGWKKVAANYTAEHMVQETEGLYQKTLRSAESELEKKRGNRNVGTLRDISLLEDHTGGMSGK